MGTPEIPEATAADVTFLSIPQQDITASPSVALRTWGDGTHTAIIYPGTTATLSIHVSDPAVAEAHAATWAEAARLLRAAQEGGQA